MPSIKVPGRIAKSLGESPSAFAEIIRIAGEYDLAGAPNLESNLEEPDQQLINYSLPPELRAKMTTLGLERNSSEGLVVRQALLWWYK